MKTNILKALALVLPPLAIFTGDFFAATELNVGQISDQFFGDVLIIPAGYAFSIWGVIYLGILALAVVQALPRYGDNPRFRAARLPLIANMICNFAWIVAWQSLLFPLATVILFAQLATGIWLYFALGIVDRSDISNISGIEKWLQVPIRIYVGWLTVASVVGVSALLHSLEWGALGMSYSAWAAIMVVVSSVIGAALTIHWKDPVYALVFVWALAAIALRPDQAGSVVAVAAVLAAGFAVLSAFMAVATKRQ